eukprot:1156927-Pelagomonas_calceolata.AAC.4
MIRLLCTLRNCSTVLVGQSTLLAAHHQVRGDYLRPQIGSFQMFTVWSALDDLLTNCLKQFSTQDSEAWKLLALTYYAVAHFITLGLEIAREAQAAVACTLFFTCKSTS